MMRVSNEQVMENRRTILDAAGRLFRERGFEAVTVAEIMKAAGLTHGGFYGYFESKDELIVEALAEALTRTRTGRLFMKDTANPADAWERPNANCQKGTSI
jgi:TetR/AcrR family transcriptional regulator, transcriptional repressor for nem operon